MSKDTTGQTKVSGYLYRGKVIKRKPHSDSSADYIVIDKRLVTNPQEFKDEAMIFLLDRNTLGITGNPLKMRGEWYKKALNTYPAPTILTKTNILVQVPEGLKDFLMWENSVVSVSGSSNHAIATFETIIPIAEMVMVNV